MKIGAHELRRPLPQGSRVPKLSGMRRARSPDGNPASHLGI